MGVICVCDVSMLYKLVCCCVCLFFVENFRNETMTATQIISAKLCTHSLAVRDFRIVQNLAQISARFFRRPDCLGTHSMPTTAGGCLNFRANSETIFFGENFNFVQTIFFFVK